MRPFSALFRFRGPSLPWRGTTLHEYCWNTLKPKLGIVTGMMRWLGRIRGSTRKMIDHLVTEGCVGCERIGEGGDWGRFRNATRLKYDLWRGLNSYVVRLSAVVIHSIMLSVGEEMASEGESVCSVNGVFCGQSITAHNNFNYPLASTYSAPISGRQAFSCVVPVKDRPRHPAPASKKSPVWMN